MSACAAYVGAVAGLTWIVLDVVNGEPQTVVVQVSVMSSPHALVAALRVDVTVPLIRHSPDAPLVYVKSLGTAAPQATVIAGCAAYTGAAAGLT